MRWVSFRRAAPLALLLGVSSGCTTKPSLPPSSCVLSCPSFAAVARRLRVDSPACTTSSDQSKTCFSSALRMEEQLVPTGVRVRYFVPGQATPLLVENVTSTDSTMTDGASQAVLYRITLQGQGTAAVDCDGQHFDTTVAAVTRCASSGQTGAATRCLSGSCP